MRDPRVERPTRYHRRHGDDSVVVMTDDMFQTLDDIEVAMKIISQTSSSENSLDVHYKSLRCDLQSLNREDDDFKVTLKLSVNSAKLDVDLPNAFC